MSQKNFTLILGDFVAAILWFFNHEAAPEQVREGLSPKKVCETLSVLLDSGGVASRLDELAFAGVCPAASP
jgi:hypothetical protein